MILILPSWRRTKEVKIHLDDRNEVPEEKKKLMTKGLYPEVLINDFRV